MKKPRHDHRQSLWIILGGLAAWCYRCGAWRLADESPAAPTKWHRPTGLRGKNLAMKGTK